MKQLTSILPALFLLGFPSFAVAADYVSNDMGVDYNYNNHVEISFTHNNWNPTAVDKICLGDINYNCAVTGFLPGDFAHVGTYQYWGDFPSDITGSWYTIVFQGANRIRSNFEKEFVYLRNPIEGAVTVNSFASGVLDVEPLSPASDSVEDYQMNECYAYITKLDTYDDYLTSCSAGVIGTFDAVPDGTYMLTIQSENYADVWRSQEFVVTDNEYTP